MGALSKLTGSSNYFEDFEVGTVMRHVRGKTITPLENVLITNLVMNTAQGHFNEHAMESSPFKHILSYGGVNFSMVLGLACQDCCENALAELGLDVTAVVRNKAIEKLMRRFPIGTRDASCRESVRQGRSVQHLSASMAAQIR